MADWLKRPQERPKRITTDDKNEVLVINSLDIAIHVFIGTKWLI